MIAKHAILTAIGAAAACSLEDPGRLNVGSASSSDAVSFDSSASDLSTTSEPDVDSGPAAIISFTFIDGSQGWIFEGAYPVAADDIVETWISPNGDAEIVSDSGPDGQNDANIAGNVAGPALVYTFDCPPPDTYDVGDANVDGAGMNITFKGSSTQIAPYVGKTMHFVGSFTGHIGLYQFFAQDLDSSGYGAGFWQGLGLTSVNSNVSSGTLNAVSEAFPGLQDGGDTGAKFGMQFSCGSNSGPVTVVVNSITFE